ncbi:uncharacterized protein LOC103367072, partial [Stegastes partitus]
MVHSCVGNAMATPSAQQQHQDYFRSVSSESTTYMMVPAGGPSGTGRKEAPSKMWVAMVVIVVVVLQIASTTGLFVYLNMSISQVRSQGVTEELKCLSLLNALDKDQDIPDQLAQLFGEPCIKLAEGIKAYISKVTENIISKQTFIEARTMPRSFNNSGSKFVTSVAQRPSAHLTLRDTSSQGEPSRSKDYCFGGQRSQEDLEERENEGLRLVQVIDFLFQICAELLRLSKRVRCEPAQESI